MRCVGAVEVAIEQLNCLIKVDFGVKEGFGDILTFKGALLILKTRFTPRTLKSTVTPLILSKHRMTPTNGAV